MSGRARLLLRSCLVMALGGRGQGKASLESLGPESAAARVHYVTLQTLYGLCFEEEEACLGPARGLVTSHQRREKEGA